MIRQQKKQQFAFASRKMLLPFAVLMVIAFTVKAERTKLSITSIDNEERIDTVNASFPGGEKEKFRYLMPLINAAEYKMGIQRKSGTVKIQFTVDETGNLTDFFVSVESNLPHLTNLIIQTLKNGPLWIPKKINGIPVSSTAQLGVDVSVEDGGRMAHYIYY